MPQDAEGSLIRGNVAFTGRLASMKRAEAFDLVRKHGGTPRRGVTRGTAVLVVGQLGWPLLADGAPSQSLSRARSLGVAIASERRFLECIGRAAPDDQIRTYSADQLASLSALPADIIDQLSLFGVLDPRHGRYRFRDLASARQVAELLAGGVTLSVITRSLSDIQQWLPDAGLSNLRLFPASRDGLLVEHLRGRTDGHGQFVLPVDGNPDDADLLFEQAQAAEDARDWQTAERLYRRVMKADPGDPAAPFNLGNLLRTAERKVEAEAAFRASVRTDPGFAEAWYNLADLLDNQGRADGAADCLRRALGANPEHADSLFNLAALLQRLERHAEAVGYWRRYLALDAASPWRERAKRSLKYCEMQIAHSP